MHPTTFEYGADHETSEGVEIAAEKTLREALIRFRTHLTMLFSSLSCSGAVEHSPDSSMHDIQRQEMIQNISNVKQTLTDTCTDQASLVCDHTPVQIIRELETKYNLFILLRCMMSPASNVSEMQKASLRFIKQYRSSLTMNFIPDCSYIPRLRQTNSKYKTGHWRAC